VLQKVSQDVESVIEFA
jgi:hypothetical protein